VLHETKIGPAPRDKVKWHDAGGGGRREIGPGNAHAGKHPERGRKINPARRDAALGSPRVEDVGRHEGQSVSSSASSATT